jgi:hypothetical protein
VGKYKLSRPGREPMRDLCRKFFAERRIDGFKLKFGCDCGAGEWTGASAARTSM